MPVIGTPVQTPTIPGQGTGLGQLTIVPTLTQVEGSSVPAKIQGIQVVQGQLATVSWTMKDRNGDPVDLTNVSGGTVNLIIRESMSLDGQVDAGTLLVGSIVNATAGQVQATLTADVTYAPGISVAEFGIFLNNALVFTNWFYLIVEPSQSGFLLGERLTMQGPPSMAEIRLHLRDVDPGGNLWMGTYEWDLAEIAACIVRPIQQFNEAPPPITRTYTTATFPWRHNWLNAICGNLMRISADWYRRVHLPYQGGGLAIDDKNKFQQYDARGKELQDEWKTWTQWKRVQLNADEAYQTMGSSYSNFGWY
jgi:hypothetical protein